MSCGVGLRQGLDPVLLCLWCRLAAVALIWPLAWEPPYALSAALKRQKGKKKKKKENVFSCWIKRSVNATSWWCCSSVLYPILVFCVLVLSIRRYCTCNYNCKVLSISQGFKIFIYLFRPHPWYMEVPRPGLKSRPQLQQPWVINPLNHSSELHLWLLKNFCFYFTYA